LLLVVVWVGGSPLTDAFGPRPSTFEAEGPVAVEGVVMLPSEGEDDVVMGALVTTHPSCEGTAPVETLSGLEGRFTLRPEDVASADCPVEVRAEIAGWSASVKVDRDTKKVALRLLPHDRDVPAEPPEIRAHVFVRNYVGRLMPAWGARVLVSEVDAVGVPCSVSGATADAEGRVVLAAVPPCGGGEPRALVKGREYRLTAEADSDWWPAGGTIRIDGDVQRTVILLKHRGSWIPQDGMRRHRSWEPYE